MKHSIHPEPHAAQDGSADRDVTNRVHATDAEHARQVDASSVKALRGRRPGGAPRLDALAQHQKWTRETLGLSDGRACDLDVGFGRGGSLRYWVAQRAETAGRELLAIEIKHGCAASVHAWAAARQADHVSVFQGDVLMLLRMRAVDLRFNRIFVHFPDPWWKARHAKRKVLRSDTLPSFWDALEPGGHLYLQTDVEDRAQSFIALAGALPGAHLTRPDRNPYPSVSNREVRAEQDGLPIFRVDVAKAML